MTHHPECEDATGEYPGSCTCAIIKQEVSDALVEVLDQLNVGNGWDDTEDYARRVYEALAKRGLKIVEVER